MYEAGYESDLGCNALRRWSIDPNADDGGILGASGWQEKKGREIFLTQEEKEKGQMRFLSTLRKINK